MKQRMQAGFGLFAVALSMGVYAQAKAQTDVSENDIARRLASPVNIVVSDATLDNIATQLTTQTGVPIHPAPDLGPQRLALRMHSASAAKVLDSLVELYGWQLEVSGDGGVRIVRPVVKIPPDIAGVPPALLSAIPIEFQRFLGLDTPVPEAPKNSRMPVLIRKVDQARKLNGIAVEKIGSEAPLQNAKLRLLWAERPPQVKPGQDYASTKWTDVVREKVLLSLLYPVLARSEFSLFQALYVGLRPFESHPEWSQIKYSYSKSKEVSGLDIGYTSTDAQGGTLYISFGCNIWLLRNLPQPQSQR